MPTSAPPCAVLADWLSMQAPLGSGSRPSFVRTAAREIARRLRDQVGTHVLKAVVLDGEARSGAMPATSLIARLARVARSTSPKISAR